MSHAIGIVAIAALLVIVAFFVYLLIDGKDR